MAAGDTAHPQIGCQFSRLGRSPEACGMRLLALPTRRKTWHRIKTSRTRTLRTIRCRGRVARAPAVDRADLDSATPDRADPDSATRDRADPDWATRDRAAAWVAADPVE